MGWKKMYSYTAVMNIIEQPDSYRTIDDAMKPLPKSYTP